MSAVVGEMARLEFADEPLYIKSASVVGVLERLTKSKRYVFQIELEWSDGKHSKRSVTWATEREGSKGWLL